MTDPKTISVYDSRAAEYDAKNRDYSEGNPRIRDFIAACLPGGRALDLGCGPGVAAEQMAAAGLQVDAMDASAEMVRMAAVLPGVSARQGTFDDIDGLDLYDGIWANFSLLHASKAAFPGHLADIRTALKPGGVFAIGMKLGAGEARDSIGRLYAYYTETELVGYLTDAGFTPASTVKGAGPGLDGSISDWVSIICHD